MCAILARPARPLLVIHLAFFLSLTAPLSGIGATGRVSGARGAGGGGTRSRRRVSLRAADLPAIPVFSAWTNSTLTLGNTPDSTTRQLDVAAGAIVYPPPLDPSYATPLYVLPGVLSREAVATVLALLTRRGGPAWDTDPDSIDGMTSDELHLMSDEPEYMKPGGGSALKGDSDPAQLSARAPLRKAVSAVLDPVVQGLVLPFVRQRFPELCSKGAGRTCRVCSSVLRRYLPGARRGVATHQDHEAVATVVISLSDYGREYTGGLYVTGGTGRKLLPLLRGDAVVHTTQLSHGVSLASETSKRWSVVFWIRDSDTCEAHNMEWHRGCAAAGNPVCQYLQAMILGRDPTQRARVGAARQAEALDLMKQSAMGGYGPSLRQVGETKEWEERVGEHGQSRRGGGGERWG
jgi:hypothetical protein